MPAATDSPLAGSSPAGSGAGFSTPETVKVTNADGVTDGALVPVAKNDTLGTVLGEITQRGFDKVSTVKGGKKTEITFLMPGVRHPTDAPMLCLTAYGELRAPGDSESRDLTCR